ncbi:MAG: TatD family hydrolase, partial [Pseudomonadales bacterium]
TDRAALLVDSHCHLNYLEDPEQRLDAARARGVGAFLCIGVDEAGIDQVLALAEAHEDVWASVGQHPEAAAADPGWIVPRLAHPRVVAAGEMGLDYAHDPGREQRRQQLERFDFQLGLAADRKLPVIIHTRAAEADTLARLRAHEGVFGVLHCFTESWGMASAALDLGYYVSISGIVTFKNADNVREVARRVPDERLLVETDSPWLAPVPYRGKRNEPAYVAETAAFLAQLRNQSLADLTASTTENFARLFSRIGTPG